MPMISETCGVPKLDTGMIQAWPDNACMFESVLLGLIYQY